MKRIIFVIAILATLAVGAFAQYYPYPTPPRPPICTDEPICTPMGGCRWVTICR